MRVLIILLAGLLPLSASGDAQSSRDRPLKKPSAGVAPCSKPGVHQADLQNGSKARKLGELPPGDLQLAVFREVDGCMDLVIVRRDVGSAGTPRR